jgi:nucleoside-diphosphate-sugar epimerase
MKRVVVFGCGFVGSRAARLFAGNGWDVTGITRSSNSAQELAGEPYRVLACDITEPAAVAGIPELLAADAVISAVSSGRGGGEEAYRKVYLKGLENITGLLNPGRVLFVSSTSVYGQNDGSWVTEESPAEPQSPTSRILRAAEDLALARGGQVARLAGIYGPGRSVLLRKFLEGTAVIEGDGGRHINQIHADDAAQALFHMIAAGLPAGIYNVADDQPATQLACCEWLAEALGRPLPPHGPVDIARKRGVTNKRVSNRKLRALGWQLQFPTYQAALAPGGELLAAALADGSGDAQP